MCRILGVWSKNQNFNVDNLLVTRMRDTMHLGGPDDAGIVCIEENSFYLAHRRLSIIDLSPLGHQPMVWNDYTIVFNGEIYNYKEIRNELIALGCSFNSDSDTEVIIQAYHIWGTSSWSKLNGMFAFALYDSTTKKIYLVRDRLGVKPLYYYSYNDVLIFASELKSILANPSLDREIDHKAVSLYLQTGYIKSPYSIFKNIRKVRPGHYMEIQEPTSFHEKEYWKLKPTVIDPEWSDQMILDHTEALLQSSFDYRMVADVPVGIFLSGGIDSTLVTALLQRKSSKPIHTFTIGFKEEQFNEAHFAKVIANKLETEHHELYCEEKDFKKTLNIIFEVFDEPFGDSSAIPTYLVSKLAKKFVKVSLSADGGDELFGGYLKYLICINYWNSFRRFPLWLRKYFSKTIKFIPVNVLNWILKFLKLNTIFEFNENRVNKFAQILNSISLTDFMLKSSQYLDEYRLQKLHLIGTPAYIFEESISSEDLNEVSTLGFIDIKSYLEGDILAKVDRASMANGLEGREPFLDYRLVEWALALPSHLKISGTKSKYVLRTILSKYVPTELIERPKMGFAIPIEKWTRTILKEELAEMKDSQMFCNTFKLNQRELDKIITTFLSNKQTEYNPNFIWFLFSLYKWYKTWYLNSSSDL
jgi:asparagine synthase (glutamine-hydrolysing)